MTYAVQNIDEWRASKLGGGWVCEFDAHQAFVFRFWMALDHRLESRSG